MSYIFDALQRAEAESAKADEQWSSTALELLERAERQAAAHYGAESPGKAPIVPGTEHQSPRFSSEGSGECASETDFGAITTALHDAHDLELLSQCEELELAQLRNNCLVCLGDGDSPATEAFHLLGERLRNLRRERKLKCVLITSTVPQEGKSMVAANLACTLGSGTRQKVLLLEGDIRRPALSALFGIARVPGLCNYLLGNRSLAASLYRMPKAGIWILPAGDNRGDLRELLQSAQLPGLMKALNSYFDWIVIDSPPVLPLVDTSIWTRLSDGILIVTRHGITRKQELQKGLEALDADKVIGTILNSTNSSIDSYNYYYRHPIETPKTQEDEAS